jgi:hypothetical protein
MLLETYRLIDHSIRNGLLNVHVLYKISSSLFLRASLTKSCSWSPLLRKSWLSLMRRSRTPTLTNFNVRVRVWDYHHSHRILLLVLKVNCCKRRVCVKIEILLTSSQWHTSVMPMLIVFLVEIIMRLKVWIGFRMSLLVFLFKRIAVRSRWNQTLS